MTPPRYSQLPIDPAHPPRSSWGVFGPDDDIGAMNLLTAERTREAAGLIRRGDIFSLNWELDSPSPPILGRQPLRHVVHDGPSGPDDHYDAFFPQASSQWDALSHVRHPEHGYYNGWTQDRITGLPGSRLGIEAWGRRGLAGRFVLVDVAGLFAARGTPIDASTTTVASLDDIQDALRRQRTKVTPGTFLLFNFGWTSWYASADAATRERLARGADFSDVANDLDNFFPAPGIARDEEVAEWLWDSGVVAVAADTPAVEAMPMHRGGVEGFLHYRLVVLLGIGIGELWDLRSLAADCARDGVYEGFLTSAPLNKLGGTGSPANALAFK